MTACSDWPCTSRPSILAEAESTPTPRIALGFTEKRQKLVRVLMAAQKLWGDLPFFLSVRKAGEACGLKHSAANAAMKKFEDDGIVACVKKGTRGINGQTAWWRCLVESLTGVAA